MFTSVFPSQDIKKIQTSFHNYRVSIKSFPDYKHLLQENNVEYKHTNMLKFYAHPVSVWTLHHWEFFSHNKLLSETSAFTVRTWLLLALVKWNLCSSRMLLRVAVWCPLFRKSVEVPHSKVENSIVGHQSPSDTVTHSRTETLTAPLRRTKNSYHPTAIEVGNEIIFGLNTWKFSLILVWVGQLEKLKCGDIFIIGTKYCIYGFIPV